MISTEWVITSYGKVLMTHLVRIHVEAQQIITMPKGSSHNLGRTPNDVARKKTLCIVDIFGINALIPQVNVDFFPR